MKVSMFSTEKGMAQQQDANCVPKKASQFQTKQSCRLECQNQLCPDFKKNR